MKDVEEPGRGLAEIVEDLVVDLHDVAPTVTATEVLVSAGIVGNVSGLERRPQSTKNASAKMVACVGLGPPYGTNLG